MLVDHMDIKGLAESQDLHVEIPVQRNCYSLEHEKETITNILALPNL